MPERVDEENLVSQIIGSALTDYRRVDEEFDQYRALGQRIPYAEDSARLAISGVINETGISLLELVTFLAMDTEDWQRHVIALLEGEYELGELLEEVCVQLVKGGMTRSDPLLSNQDGERFKYNNSLRRRP